MSIWIRRAYEAPTHNDGYRVLVDRVWPRGVTKKALEIDAWMRDIAPSTSLRKWFDHKPTRWAEFQRRYFRELRRHEEALCELAERVRSGTRVTLVFGARDTEHNNAVAIRNFLREKIEQWRVTAILRSARAAEFPGKGARFARSSATPEPSINERS